MIRCIPVDGSEPFEVENAHRLKHELPDGVWMYLAASDVIDTNRAIIYRWIAVDDDQQRVCRIESWRERAERLEKELAALRAKIASDAMDERRLSGHG